MSIPVSIDPLGTLGAFIPPGWKRAEFVYGIDKSLATVAMPMEDDVLQMRFVMDIEHVTYGILGYFQPNASSAYYKRICVQQLPDNEIQFRNANSGDTYKIYVSPEVNDMTFTKEGVTLNGQFINWDRDAFDASYNNRFNISSKYTFYGAELIRDGRKVMELVPYRNGDRQALADMATKQFFEI